MRELAILGIAGAGSLLFMVHEGFYFASGSIGFALPARTPPWAYLLLTGVLYLFLRMVFLVAGLFFVRERPEYIVCPECGRRLTDTSPDGVEAHRRLELTPRPTEREVMAAIMLRRAIDDARRSARKELTGPIVEFRELPGDVENPPVSLEEFDRILRELDGGRTGRPSDRGPRGPEGRPPRDSRP